MPRREKLDKYVTPYTDVRGKRRYRFRRMGFDTHVPAPTDPQYKEAYEAAMQGCKVIVRPARDGSVEDMIRRYYDSVAFANVSEVRRKNLRSILEPFREEYRDFMVRDFTNVEIEQILQDKTVETFDEKGRKRGGTSAANNLAEALNKVFKLAVKWDLADINPVEGADRPKHKGEGYHPWNRAEVAQYREAHPIGTMPRAAMEIMLWTMARRGDAIRLGDKNLIGGRVFFTANKTDKDASLMAAPPMLEAVEAAYDGQGTWIKTAYGKPFSDGGFGNWFKKQCLKADLPHCTAHGLRKALAIMGAEAGATNQQLKALGQWSGDAEVATYTFAANQAVLADQILRTILERETNID